jgi:uncharacterized membrane protein
MKQSIVSRFNLFKKDSVGTIITLSKSVRGMKYTNQEINNAFKKLVEKVEYELKDKDKILEWLYSQTKDAKKAL